MSEIVVDTSVWIEFFRGTSIPVLETALGEGRALMTPVVAAELLSGVRGASRQRRLADFLSEFESPGYDFRHWLAVGRLRAGLAAKGFQVSLPDAHVAQSALQRDAALFSFDQIFEKIAKPLSLRVIQG